MKTQSRELVDLISVGPTMLRDFEMLGVRTVAQLARQNPRRLYERLCRKTGQRVDICSRDVFEAAVAQARNPRLPAEQCQWWYWSRKRKQNKAAFRWSGKEGVRHG
jgi:nucleotidyltransferase/DNA polymerase involved in DNA repair